MGNRSTYISLQRHYPGTVFVLAKTHWHFSWQNQHEISTRFAEMGYGVIFFEPLPLRWWPGLSRALRFLKAYILGRMEIVSEHPQKESAGVETFWITGVPDQFALGTWLNRRVFMSAVARRMRRHWPRRPYIVVNYLPVSYTFELQRALEPDVTIYACTDDFTDMTGFAHVDLIEDQIVSQADFVFATSQELYDRISKAHHRVSLILHGVDYERFEPARVELPVGEPLLCAYFGTLRKSDIDYELLKTISYRYRLRIVGLIKDPLEGFSPSVEVVGPVDIDELPNRIADADVLLLPYVTDKHTRFSTPAKFFQYLATGKPIISTGLELSWLNEVVYLCKTHEEFLAAIESAKSEPYALREKRLSMARDNSWEKRIESLEKEIRDILQKKVVEDN